MQLTNNDRMYYKSPSRTQLANSGRRRRVRERATVCGCLTRVSNGERCQTVN